MRKKLDTRFPAPRIKKIMQADEDVGKIAMAVPLLVSKALELFLQDLCDRTYEITVKKGAKTVNSLHLKECVHGFNVFDFLRDTVSSVPDLVASDAASEDASATKRRKISEQELGNEKELTRISMQEAGHTSSSGRDRVRGRGRGRGIRTLQKELSDQREKFEDDPDISDHDENQNEHLEGSNNVAGAADSRTTDAKEAYKSVMNFDLNVDLNEIVDSASKLSEVPLDFSMEPSPDTKHEHIPGWSVGDVAMMAINPIELANLNKGVDEEVEDYDAEG